MKKIFIGILTTCWKVDTRTIPKKWSQRFLVCFQNFCVHEIHLFLFAKFRGNPALQWLINSSSVGKKAGMLYKCVTPLPRETTETSFNILFSLPPFSFTVPNLKSFWCHYCLVSFELPVLHLKLHIGHKYSTHLSIVRLKYFITRNVEHSEL